MKRFLLPLAAFAALSAFLYVGLRKDPHALPSPLVNRAAPAFSLTALAPEQKPFSPQDMQGRVWLLNVWASWCGACREEHPALMDLGRDVPIVGLDYKDERLDARRWLREAGDPYTQTAWDGDGRVGIDYGVYGVPETYLIDERGVIRYKQTGPMTRQVWEEKMLPLIRTPHA